MQRARKRSIIAAKCEFTGVGDVACVWDDSTMSFNVLVAKFDEYKFHFVNISSCPKKKNNLSQHLRFLFTSTQTSIVLKKRMHSKEVFFITATLPWISMKMPDESNTLIQNRIRGRIECVRDASNWSSSCVNSDVALWAHRSLENLVLS